MERALNDTTLRNETTFHQLYSDYYKALVSYARQMVDAVDEAEDVVQEAFAILWNRQPLFPTMNHVRAWLYNTVRHTAIDRLRHSQVERAYAKGFKDFDIDDTTQEEMLFEEEVLRQLFEEIDRLPARQREVFLCMMEGRKNREIAEVLQISEETVKIHRKRGLAKLRQRMNPQALDLLLMLAG